MLPIILSPDMSIFDGGVFPYYIDNTGGNDANSGRSRSSPWKTIAKVNASTFLPGDRILFKRGETFKGIGLVVPSSGSVTMPITFGAYGMGANPIIDTSIEYNDFALDSGAIWKRNEGGGNIVQAFEDGVRLIWKIDKISLVAGSFCFVAGVVYVWASDSGNPNTGHVIEYDTVQYSVQPNGKSNLVFDSIDVTKSRVSGYYFQSSTGSTNITIRNATVTFTGERSFNAGGFANLGLSNITISHCIVHDGLDECFWLGNGSNFILENCEGYNSGKDVILKAYPITHLPGGIIVGIRTNGATVRNNYIHDIYNNKTGICVEFQATYTRPVGVVIDSNLVAITSTGAGMVDEGNGSLYKNNIVIQDGGGNGMELADDSVGALVYHNTIFNSYNYANNISVTKCTNATIKNNLFIHASGTHNGLNIPAAGQTGLVLNYNQFYSNGAFRSRWTTTWYTTLATWKVACGQEANSAEGDPVVVTQWTNFHLQVTSPCIAAGDPTVGVLTDYDGVVRSAAVDIGAYEYV